MVGGAIGAVLGDRGRVHPERRGGIFHDAPWPVDEADLLARQMGKSLQSIVAASVTADLHCPPTLAVRRGDAESGVGRALAKLGDRTVVVKPSRMGASLLTGKLIDWDGTDLLKAVSAIHEFDTEALVQEFVHGDECWPTDSARWSLT